MRSVEIIVSCDRCWELTGDKVNATVTLVYGLNYGGPADKILEVCAEHAKKITVTELAELGKPYTPSREKPPRNMPAAVPVSSPKSGAKPKSELGITPCPFCGKECAAGTGIAIHVRQQHPQYFTLKTDWSRVTFDGKRVIGAA